MLFSYCHTTFVFPCKITQKFFQKAQIHQSVEGSNFMYISLYELVVLYFEF